MRPADQIFLKLGGSLITDKDRPHTALPEVLTRLAQEIAAARRENPSLSLVIGHGSGSFGHAAASQYGTRQGVVGAAGWAGFVEVWREARALNQIVLDALSSAGLPVIAFPPSAGVIARDGHFAQWDTSAMQAALQAGLIPLVNGDVIFDQTRGGTILSTEEIFFALAQQIPPRRILLAGIEVGVWADYPACTRLLPLITPDTFAKEASTIGDSASVDVTGGMLEKVRQMLALAAKRPDVQVVIFSGARPGNLFDLLTHPAQAGISPGTMLTQSA